MQQNSKKVYDSQKIRFPTWKASVARFSGSTFKRTSCTLFGLIEPGKKGEITVRYDTNRVGVFRKTITVNTNVVNAAIIALKIKGNVLAN